jgi:DNA-binding CsgD family transcriptional regulator
MATKDLSPREKQIISLCIDGLTNEGIALKLGLSVGTVNTYWLRIKIKLGSVGRADTVAMVLKDQAEQAQSLANADRSGIESVVRAGLDFLIREREVDTFSRRAALGLLKAVVDELQVTFWATDNDLRVQIVANEGQPGKAFGPSIAIGQTIYDVFESHDPADAAIASHLLALKGNESTVRIQGNLYSANLHVAPLMDEEGDIIGCIGVLSSDSPQPPSLSIERQVG